MAEGYNVVKRECVSNTQRELREWGVAKKGDCWMGCRERGPGRVRMGRRALAPALQCRDKAGRGNKMGRGRDWDQVAVCWYADGGCDWLTLCSR